MRRDREHRYSGWKREKKIALIAKSKPQWEDLSRAWYVKPVRTTFQGQS
jgi:predicted GIY-YIG superfamily endonuclease